VGREFGAGVWGDALCYGASAGGAGDGSGWGGQMKHGTVLIALASLVSVACHRFPGDREIENRFWQKQSQVNELLVLAASDKGFPHISVGLGPSGMDPARMHLYRELFNNIGVEIGIHRNSQYPDAVFIDLDAMAAWGGGASSKGYVYCTRPLSPTVQSLDDGIPDVSKDPDGKHFIAFRPLNDGWYIFLEFSDGQHQHSLR
jgi:hypothetical protein